MLSITLMKDVVCDSQFEHLVGYCMPAAARQTADVGSASGMGERLWQSIGRKKHRRTLPEPENA